MVVATFDVKRFRSKMQSVQEGQVVPGTKPPWEGKFYEIDKLIGVGTMGNWAAIFEPMPLGPRYVTSPLGAEVRKEMEDLKNNAQTIMCQLPHHPGIVSMHALLHHSLIDLGRPSAAILNPHLHIPRRCLVMSLESLRIMVTNLPAGCWIRTNNFWLILYWPSLLLPAFWKGIWKEIRLQTCDTITEDIPMNRIHLHRETGPGRKAAQACFVNFWYMLFAEFGCYRIAEHTSEHLTSHFLVSSDLAQSLLERKHSLSVEGCGSNHADLS